LKTLCKTRSSKHKKKYAIGCESIHISGDDGQLTIYRTARVRRELGDQYIASRKGKPPWSSKAFVLTVHEIEHHDVVSSGIFADEFREKHPQEWKTQALKTFKEATESYMVEVIPESHSRSSN
jgi:hypothetical protein